MALLLTIPATGQAEETKESNPNNYNCLGSLAKGTPEPGNEGQQVAYSFYCNGPITGYQLQSQVPITSAPEPPNVNAIEPGLKIGPQLKDTFSCGGELPGYAVNCVGSAKSGWEKIAGQFATEKKLCAEPRVDALLTVTYASVEKGVITQAISGPFDLGRPQGCPPDAWSGDTRLNPKPLVILHKKSSKKHKKKKASAKKAAHKAATHH
ncbi:MAG TPA: hypothetical protein VNV44_03725 [Solirubrobacteraceae bacterium]|nr:hypothetical protein [Solirubrobacteraceae bacterium]